MKNESNSLEKKTKVLVVEDDDCLRIMIKDGLEMLDRYTVYDADDGQKGYLTYRSFAPDIIVTDIEMPITTGLDMMKQIRWENAQIPIIVLSAHTDIENRKAGFEHGCIAYMPKPFVISLLDDQIQAIMRHVNRYNTKAQLYFQIGSYRFDVIGRLLNVDDQIIKLTPCETSLLRMLCENKGSIVTRKQITNVLWNYNTQNKTQTLRSLDVFVCRLRKYLSHDKTIRLIVCRGEGFLLED